MLPSKLADFLRRIRISFQICPVFLAQPAQCPVMHLPQDPAKNQPLKAASSYAPLRAATRQASSDPQ